MARDGDPPSYIVLPDQVVADDDALTDWLNTAADNLATSRGPSRQRLGRELMRFAYTIIFVPDVGEAVDFYERAFGLDRAFIHESGDYAQMATGETALAFTSHRLGQDAVPVPYVPLDPEASPAGFELTLVTDDVGTAFQRAIDAGARSLAEPHDTAWGQVVSYVRDPFGVLVGIASPMA